MKYKSWCLYQPGYGHFIDAFKSFGHSFDVPLIIEESRECRDFLQRKWKIPIIKETVERKIDWMVENSIRINLHGYYATRNPII